MKKCLLSSMLLLLISFSLFIGRSEEMAQYSFNPTDELVISTVDTIASSDIITQSVATNIPKSQTELLFQSTDTSHFFIERLVSIKLITHLCFSGKIAGFICVVQNQSNYLP